MDTVKEKSLSAPEMEFCQQVRWRRIWYENGSNPKVLMTVNMNRNYVRYKPRLKLMNRENERGGIMELMFQLVQIFFVSRSP